MSIDGKMMILRAQLYTAMQTLEGAKADEFWALLEEVQLAACRLPLRIVEKVAVPQEPFMSEDNTTIYYWPYCPTCRQPYSFDPEEPFAFCNCGTSEWGVPRPAEWIRDPERDKGIVDVATNVRDNLSKVPMESRPTSSTTWEVTKASAYVMRAFGELDGVLRKP